MILLCRYPQTCVECSMCHMKDKVVRIYFNHITTRVFHQATCFVIFFKCTFSQLLPFCSLCHTHTHTHTERGEFPICTGSNALFSTREWRFRCRMHSNVDKRRWFIFKYRSFMKHSFDYYVVCSFKTRKMRQN